MHLYDSRPSGNCYKVRLLFAHLGLAYEREDVDIVHRAGRQELLGEFNPGLRVPTLVLDDGRPLAESDAILWYFADGTDYLPTDPYERAQVLQWMFFEQYSHEPNIAVVRYWTHYAPEKPDDAAFAPKRAAGEAALKAMEAHLASREFFVGERYSIADIALYVYTHNAPESGFDLEPYPAIRAWIARVAAQPGHVPIDA